MTSLKNALNALHALRTFLLLFAILSFISSVQGNPKSRPYVAYRTDPFEQETVSIHVLADGVERRGGGGDSEDSSSSGRDGGATPKKNRTYRRDRQEGDDTRCPLSFRLGSSHSAHFDSSLASSPGRAETVEMAETASIGVGVHTPPVIFPLHPDFDAGSGRQILLTTDYEVLEMWTPASAVGHALANPAGSAAVGDAAEEMKEDEQFPLLFESSSFYHTLPLVHDVEGDGIADAILADYDGNVHLVGLDFEHFEHLHDAEETARPRRRKRFYRRVSVPRLFLRKSWFEVAINRTWEREAFHDMDDPSNNPNNNATALNATKWQEFEPYHAYFAGPSDNEWRGPDDAEALRAYSGDVLNMDAESARQLNQRRKERRGQYDHDNQHTQRRLLDLQNDLSINHQNNLLKVQTPHRRLQEVNQNLEEPQMDASEQNKSNDNLDNQNDASNNDNNQENSDGSDNVSYGDFQYGDDDGMAYLQDPDLFADDSVNAPPDGTDDKMEWHDDIPTDDYRQRYNPYGAYGDDVYSPPPPEGYSSYEEYQEAQSKYYHDSNYLRLPPHILCSPTLVELSRAYASEGADPIDQIDEILLLAVSYYFDEDQKHGRKDVETEERRGRYVANAILGYNLRWNYWSIQEVLDLSTDWSAPLGDIVQGGTAPVHSNRHGGMGAWALATPVAVKLDGGDRNHVIVGTSMGLVYVLEVQWHGTRSGWPVQMRHPVEQKVMVEDVVGNTDLEIFVVDVGGDVASFDANGQILWVRNLLNDEEELENTDGMLRVVRGTSPMSMGDVEGTGQLAIVVVAKVATTERAKLDRPDKLEQAEYRLFAIDAVTGDDLPNFPMALNAGSDLSPLATIAQPLLVDLHEDQSYWIDRIRGLDEDVDTIRTINEFAKQSNGSFPRPHGGAGRGLHIVQPLGTTLHIIEGATACSQTIEAGDSIPSMVQADDVHGTGGLDLVVTTSKGEILTFESDVVPHHPLNVWSAGATRSPGSNSVVHGYSATQGIFVHPIARQFRDILGIYIPVTFEIFDRRPSIDKEDKSRSYRVEIRAGLSAKRAIFVHTYNQPGVYTERIQIPFGPGYYAISVRLRTAHGIVYDDVFHVGFNVNYMGGLWWIVCLPLVIATIPILLFRRKPNWEEDEDYGERGTGILGRAAPS